MRMALALLSIPLLLAACSGKPLVPHTTDGPPLVLVPASQAGIEDQRGRFREIACAVFEESGKDLPHYRHCEDALTRVGPEAGATGQPVNLGNSDHKLIAAIVPGIGWECFQNWLDFQKEFESHIEQFGYKSRILQVAGMSGTETNARMIRDAIMDHADEIEPGQLVLLGYSKGAPDVLEAVVRYPEIRPYISAVVSISGAIGGSPLAYDASESDLNLLKHIPKSTCTGGDGKAVESLHPSVRRAWLAANPLPGSIRYYSVVTFPQQDQISSILKSTWKKLARVDPRNDSQVIVYDQVIPGSTLLAYLNADHWAIAVPIAESHPFIGKHFVDRNTYPRKAMFEALMRFIDEDLGR